MKIKKIIIPAGTYYIGDPGLILSREMWTNFYSSKNDDYVHQHDGHSLIIVPLDGDGIQFDSDKYKYAIDTGSIAIIPIELVAKDVPVAEQFVRRKTFLRPVMFRYVPYEFMSIGGIFFDMSEGEELDYDYESEVEGHECWKEWEDEG